jgi:uncharacterized membrane protein
MRDMSPPGESRTETLVYRWCGLSVLAGTLASLVVLHHQAGWEGVRALGALALTSLFVLGKFVIFLGISDEAPLGPFALGLMVWLLDLLCAFALASGLSGFERAPMLGRWLRRARRRSRRVLEDFPRLQRWAFLGVVAFVLLPIASTGAVTGSFAARLLGLSRLTGVVAVALGSAGTAGIFALLALFLGEPAQTMLSSPLLAFASIVGLALFAVIAYRRVLELLRKE